MFDSFDGVAESELAGKAEAENEAKLGYSPLAARQTHSAAEHVEQVDKPGDIMIAGAEAALVALVELSL